LYAAAAAAAATATAAAFFFIISPKYTYYHPFQKRGKTNFKN
jgi:hypothetical protein